MGKLRNGYLVLNLNRGKLISNLIANRRATNMLIPAITADKLASHSMYNKNINNKDPPHETVP